jgi:hypothetical protein
MVEAGEQVPRLFFFYIYSGTEINHGHIFVLASLFFADEYAICLPVTSFYTCPVLDTQVSSRSFSVTHGLIIRGVVVEGSSVAAPP